MATDRIQLYDRFAQCLTPVVTNEEPVLDSTNAPWLGLKLQHYRAGNTERPEATTNSYLAAVCLAGSYKTEYLSSSGRRGFKVESGPGHVFLTGPGELPARRSVGKIEFLVLELAPKFIVWAADELAANGQFEIRQLWSDKDDQVRYLMCTLYHELLAGCPSGRLFGEYLGLSLATAILTRYSVAPAYLTNDRGGLSAYNLRKVTAYINDNLSMSLSLVDMANLLEMGPAHFARAFKVSTGVSPHQYVLRRRIERALQILKEAPVSLAQLAYDLGFSSQGHFTTVFRSLVGIPPGNYREQLLSLRDLEVMPYRTERSRPPAKTALGSH